MMTFYYIVTNFVVDKWQYIWKCCVILASLMLIAYYKSITENPNCCDANDYLVMAKQINEHGLFTHDLFGLRTYLYPYIISLFNSDVSGYINYTAFIYLLSYLLSLMMLSKANIKQKWPMLIALFSNPILLMYIPFTLTEGYILIIFSLLCSLIAYTINTLYSDSTRQYYLLAFIVIGILSGAMVEIRPASIIILPCVFFTLLWFSPQYLPYAKVNWIKHKLIYLPFMLFPVVFGFSLVVSVQILSNMKFYGSLTFLPAAPYGGTSLSNFLMTAGMDIYKYGTMHSAGLTYHATNFVGDVSRYNVNPLEFYFTTPKGWFMMLVHVYQSLNYDFLKTYITVQHYPIFSWYQILSSIITSLGFAGVCVKLKSFKTEVLDVPHHFFLLLTIIATLGLCAVISAETRYGLVAQMGLGYFAMIFVMDEYRLLSLKWRYAVLSLVLIYVSLSVYVSWWFIQTAVGVKPIGITWF